MLSDFDLWAPGAEGEQKVRAALAHNWTFFGDARELAHQWLSMKSTERGYAALVAAVEVAKKASQAAAASTRWSMMAAIAAAVGSLVTAAVAAVMLLTPPTPQTVKLDLAVQPLKAEKILPAKPGPQ